ncbi:lasso peptide biosynthesis PqqD family chaperone [Streptomyces qinglanensis]|uniref:lasso peptide biosynthesis PqqD family chaperone n=1 Tax=Streptomyces qinglanensis TaxID=943816 RepID=UPI003D751D3B
MTAVRKGVLLADTEYGTALLDQESAEYWTLNPTGALILRTLLDGGTLEDAVRALTDQYDVSPDQARSDAEDIVDELATAGLLTR